LASGPVNCLMNRPRWATGKGEWEAVAPLAGGPSMIGREDALMRCSYPELGQRRSAKLVTRRHSVRPNTISAASRLRKPKRTSLSLTLFAGRGSGTSLVDARNRRLLCRQVKIAVFAISAHHPAMLLQSGNPFRIAFVAFDMSKASGSNRPPTHSSNSSCRSFSGFWMASKKSG
jgi:hypothetical protein